MNQDILICKSKNQQDCISNIGTFMKSYDGNYIVGDTESLGCEWWEG